MDDNIYLIYIMFKATLDTLSIFFGMGTIPPNVVFLVWDPQETESFTHDSSSFMGRRSSQLIKMRIFEQVLPHQLGEEELMHVVLFSLST